MAALGSPFRLALLLCWLFISIPCAAAAEFEAWDWQAANTRTAVAAEVKRLQGRLFDPGFSAAEADRLVRIQLAASAESRAVYRRRLQRVEAGRREVVAKAAAILAGGPYESAWLNDRWMNGGLSARTAEARELFRRTYADQFVLQAAPQQFHEVEKAALSALLAPEARRIGRDNAQWLRTTLDRIGWFDIKRYGAEASQAAWLIVQHADFDPAWQRHMLQVLEPKVATGDMQARYFAYLVDRVAHNSGKRQTYGTQGRCVGPGNWQPFETDDPGALDQRRKAVGLDPIEDYRSHFICR